MIELWIKAVVGVTAILCGWLAVQQVWRHNARLPAGQDALSGRLGCHGCDCHQRCGNEEHGTDQRVASEPAEVLPSDRPGAI
jgi:hypothetical protein